MRAHTPSDPDTLDHVAYQIMGQVTGFITLGHSWYGLTGYISPWVSVGGRWWPGANRRQAINDHHADFRMISVRSIISCNIWFASGQRGGRWWPGAKKHQAISDHHASMTYEWLASEVSYPEGYNMIRIGSLTSIKQSIVERGDRVRFITNTKLFVIGPDIRPVLSTKYLRWP